jgi:hypothetical protein
MRRAAILLAIIALLAAPAAVLAQNEVTADLTGDAETPPVATDATGSANVVISDDGSSISFEVTFEDLSGDGTATMAHIHYGPDQSEPGPVMIWLTEVGVPDGSFASPISGTATEAEFVAVDGGPQNFAEAVQAIRDGDTYVNVHTAAYPGGEIRGQLMGAGEPPLPDTSAAEAVPAAGGTAAVILLAAVALVTLLAGLRRFGAVRA